MRTRFAATLAMAFALLGTTSAARADARGDKVQLYIEVHNMFAQRMHANFDRYRPALEGLDPDSPCAGDRHPGRDMYNTADSTGTIPEFRRRLRRAPRLPQDALVTAMLDAAAIEIPAWNAAHDYYARRVFTTDGCAQGNAYHRQLMAAFDAFFAADDQLLAFLDAETRAAREREIVAVERAHGQGFRYAQLRIVSQLETLRDVLSATNHDVDALGRALDALAASSAEITPRAQTAEREIHADLYQGQYLTFLGSVDTLVSAGRRFVTAIRDTRADASARERAFRELDRAFSQAIEASNRVRYSDRVH